MELIKGEKVVLWGDSLGKGVVWNEERKRYGYTDLTAAQVAAEKLGIEIVNHAKFGATAPQGLTILEHDLDKGMDCDAAVLEFGGNDCNFKWAEISHAPDCVHEPATLPDTFEQALGSMVEKLQKEHIRPILLTLPPINADRYFHFLVGDQLNAENILHWLGDVQQIYRYQEMYSLIVEKVARAFQIQLMDLRVRCLNKWNFTNNLLCADGLHMTDQGQAFVGDEIVKMVKERGK